MRRVTNLHTMQRNFYSATFLHLRKFSEECEGSPMGQRDENLPGSRVASVLSKNSRMHALFAPSLLEAAPSLTGDPRLAAAVHAAEDEEVRREWLEIGFVSRFFGENVRRQKWVRAYSKQERRYVSIVRSV